MSFSKEDNIKFQNFLQSVLERPRVMEAQPHVIKDGRVWCEDWRIIELLKYFINGREMYIGDPPPNRLKNNSLWSKEAIMSEAEDLALNLVHADNIIKYLQSLREAEYVGGA